MTVYKYNTVDLVKYKLVIDNNLVKYFVMYSKDGCISIISFCRLFFDNLKSSKSKSRKVKILLVEMDSIFYVTNERDGIVFINSFHDKFRYNSNKWCIRNINKKVWILYESL